MITSRKFQAVQPTLLLSVLACVCSSFAEPAAGSQKAGGKQPSAQCNQCSPQRLAEVTAQLQDLADQAKKAAQEASLAVEKASSLAAIANAGAQRAVEGRTNNTWYQDPAWYALATPIALATIAILAFRERKRASIADAQRHALLRAVEINEAFIRHKIPGPVALNLGIPHDKVDMFTKKAVLLLHQLILLRQIYEQKDLLGILAEQSHQQWASKVLGPWIDSDPDLVKLWGHLRQGGDLFGEDFLKWLVPHISPRAPANPPPQPTSGTGTTYNSPKS